MKRSMRKWRKVWKNWRKAKTKHPKVQAIHLQPGDRIILPGTRTEGRVQYNECTDAVFVSSKAKQSMRCITYLTWDAISKKKVPNQKLYLAWNDDVEVVKEPKSKWPTVYGFISKLAKRMEVKRDW